MAVDHVELLTRIAVAGLLGGVIGFERLRHGRPVGLRTHLLVSMASATFMVVSAKFVYFQHYSKDDLVAVDPSRIAASVVSGIGFLAGGSILRTGATIQGLTTAAGLWLVTAIGLCCGAGMFVEGAVTTGLGMLALTAVRKLEAKDDRIRRRISIVLADGEGGTVSDLVKQLSTLGAVVGDMDYERRLDDKRRLEVTFDVKLPRNLELGRLIECLESIPGVRRVNVQAVL